MEKFAAVPSNHSPQFAPDPATLAPGVRTLVSGALAYLVSRKSLPEFLVQFGGQLRVARRVVAEQPAQLGGERLGERAVQGGAGALDGAPERGEQDRPGVRGAPVVVARHAVGALAGGRGRGDAAPGVLATPQVTSSAVYADSRVAANPASSRQRSLSPLVRNRINSLALSACWDDPASARLLAAEHHQAGQRSDAELRVGQGLVQGAIGVGPVDAGTPYARPRSR